MSFTVSVRRNTDDGFFASEPMDVRSAEWATWFDEATRRTLLFEPVAGDASFFNYWHTPAVELGLELLAQVYHRGLSVSGRELVDLGQELETLRTHWDLAGIIDLQAVRTSVENGVEEEISLRDHMANRLQTLRSAIELAQTCDGTLTIS